MLKIFYARESVNKSKFIYENINSNSLILVPDQFTLEAERDALKYLKTEGLMDIEVMSISRLGLRVLQELGGEKKQRVSKYGRFMLLTKIVADMEKKNKINMYKGMYRKPSFIDMLNNIISEIKQHSISTEDLMEIANKESGILKLKLMDICSIYVEYEKCIANKFIDTEDYIDLFLPKLKDSKLVANRDVWLYGFDYLSPKNLDLIGELITSIDVNIVFTCDYDCRDEDVFWTTQKMIFNLCNCAKDKGIQYSVEKIRGTEKKCAEEISIIEKELFSLPRNTSIINKNNLTLVKASNYYTEAETAATYITTLIRDKELKLGDILVICNDTTTRGSVIKRVFSEYGLDIFIDTKKSILGNPVATYIMALLNSAAGMNTEDVISLLKTGLCATVSLEETEILENYAIKYRIRGKNWEKPFLYGEMEYGEEDFAKINDIRERVSNLFNTFFEEFKKSKVTSHRLKAIYIFLRDEAKLGDMIGHYIEEKEKLGLFEAVQETAQVWNEFVNILEELNEILGEEDISIDMLTQIIQSGLAAVEVGMIPPTVDGLILGTMQRTRVSDKKALIVLGANDGVIPANTTPQGLLNEEEKIHLMADGKEISKADAMRVKEETLAIYKCLSSPAEYLFMSCSTADLDGKPIRAAKVFNDIQSLFVNVPVNKDIINQNDALSLIQTKNSSIKHMINASKNLDHRQEWKNAATWYKKNDPELMEFIKSGVFYKAKKLKLDSSNMDIMFSKQCTISPTRLEKYGRCPFSYFINYGLKPQEMRLFEISSIETGEICHEILLYVSEHLSKNINGLTWENITDDELDQIIESLMQEQKRKYKEGLLSSGYQEEYRTHRLKEIVRSSAKAMIEQVRIGSIKKMYFEVPFAQNSYIPAVEIETEIGTIYVEGKIDRVDILEDDTVKIIDYKSGNNEFNKEEAEKGFRLQLMLYLKAALGMKWSEELKPAGVFYFHIKEADITSDGISKNEIEKIAKEIQKTFKMNGVVINNRNAIRNISGDFEGYSDVIKGLRRLKEPSQDSGSIYSGTNALMEGKEFDEFMDKFNANLKNFVQDLFKGEISAEPRQHGTVKACEYCGYKGICKFDVTIPGCRWKRS